LSEDLIKQIESILFSYGKSVEIEELGRLCKSNKASISKALTELKKRYNSDQTALMLVEEGTKFKLTIREQYQNIVKKIITETELPKTIIETLAIVAWKAPVLQSKVINLRTNKAYEHLKLLEESGYLTRQKQGRSKMIKLAPKFFEYFDIPKEQVKQKFEKFTDVEQVITQKEGEINEIKKQIEQNSQANEKLETDVKQIFDENVPAKMPKVQQQDEMPTQKSDK